MACLIASVPPPRTSCMACLLCSRLNIYAAVICVRTHTRAPGSLHTGRANLWNPFRAHECVCFPAHARVRSLLLTNITQLYIPHGTAPHRNSAITVCSHTPPAASQPIPHTITRWPVVRHMYSLRHTRISLQHSLHPRTPRLSSAETAQSHDSLSRWPV